MRSMTLFACAVVAGAYSPAPATEYKLDKLTPFELDITWRDWPEDQTVNPVSSRYESSHSPPTPLWTAVLTTHYTTTQPPIAKVGVSFMHDLKMPPDHDHTVSTFPSDLWEFNLQAEVAEFSRRSYIWHGDHADEFYFHFKRVRDHTDQNRARLYVWHTPTPGSLVSLGAFAVVASRRRRA